MNSSVTGGINSNFLELLFEVECDRAVIKRMCNGIVALWHCGQSFRLAIERTRVSNPVLEINYKL